MKHVLGDLEKKFFHVMIGILKKSRIPLSNAKFRPVKMKPNQIDIKEWALKGGNFFSTSLVARNKEEKPLEICKAIK